MNNDAKPHGFVLGEKAFAAISAIEGLKLQPDAERRLKETASLSPAQRRAETIRAFRQASTKR